MTPREFLWQHVRSTLLDGILVDDTPEEASQLRADNDRWTDKYVDEFLAALDGAGFEICRKEGVA